MNTKEPATSPNDAINAEVKPRNPGMKSAMDAAIAAREARKAHPYDGLMGQIPDWIPPPLRHEFNAVRDRLLESETIDNVREWMHLWRLPTDRGWMYVPPEYDRDIDSLVYIQSIVSFGPHAGIDAYLGKGGMEVVRGMARIEHNRKVAKQPRPDGLQRVILKLLRERPEGEQACPYVERRLRELEHFEVDGVTIDGIKDGAIEGSMIEWSDARTKAGDTPLSGLKDRVSRALKQFEKEKLE